MSADKRRAVVFHYLTATRQKTTATPRPVRLVGLDPQKSYRIQKINLCSGTTSTLAADKVYSGNFPLKVGFNPNVTLARSSAVLDVAEAGR